MGAFALANSTATPRQGSAIRVVCQQSALCVSASCARHRFAASVSDVGLQPARGGGETRLHALNRHARAPQLFVPASCSSPTHTGCQNASRVAESTPKLVQSCWHMLDDIEEVDGESVVSERGEKKRMACWVKEAGADAWGGVSLCGGCRRSTR